MRQALASGGRSHAGEGAADGPASRSPQPDPGPRSCRPARRASAPGPVSSMTASRCPPRRAEGRAWPVQDAQARLGAQRSSSARSLFKEKAAARGSSSEAANRQQNAAAGPERPVASGPERQAAIDRSDTLAPYKQRSLVRGQFRPWSPNKGTERAACGIRPSSVLPVRCRSGRDCASAASHAIDRTASRTGRRWWQPW